MVINENKRRKIDPQRIGPFELTEIKNSIYNLTGLNGDVKDNVVERFLTPYYDLNQVIAFVFMFCSVF